MTRAPHRSGRGLAAALAAAWLLCLAVPSNGQAAAADDVPAPDLVPPDAAERLEALAVQRLQLFEEEQADLLSAEMQRADQELQGHNQQIAALRATFAEKQRIAAFLGTIAASGRMGEKLYGAEAVRARQAADAVHAAIAATMASRQQFITTRWQPLRAKVDQFNSAWMEIYGLMRVCIPRDRTDPHAGEVAAVLEAITDVEPTFFEGYILAAVAALHAGRGVDDVDALLVKASAAAPAWFNVTEGAIAVDFVHACCLAGRPTRADKVVKALRQIHETRSTIEQDWVISLHSRASRHINEARTRLQSMRAKVRRHEAAPDAPRLAVIMADAAATCMGDTRHRGLGRLMLQTDETVRVSGAWQALRARAMLLADEGRFEAATALLHECRARAPLSMGTELDGQLALCAARETWTWR